ncbi:MAG: PAS domain-containing protein [Chloroflexi bacterium]|nr:PAS domain-containing protein [Chloroflexota bacterium]
MEEFPGSVIACDENGIILEMNAKAAKGYADRGGKALIGSNLLDCHSEASRAKVAQLLETKQLGVYTIEKNGIKKLVYHSPWYQDGKYAGIVELVVEIPFEMPHFVRK